MRFLLVVATVLMMWGPPRLRVAPRPLEAALDQPFALDAAAMFQVGTWVASALLVCLIVGGRGLQGRPAIPRMIMKSSLKWYWIYGIAALISAAYSVNPYYTTFFAGKIFVSILAIALLTSRADIASGMPFVISLFLAVNVGQWLLNLCLFAIDPRLVGTQIPSIGFRLAGGVMEDYGTPAAMAGLFFLRRALFAKHGHTGLIYWMFYLTTWVFLILSRTRSSIIGGILVFILLIVFGLRSRGRIIAAVVVGIGSLLTIASGALDSVVSFGLRGQSINSLMTLTGRTNAFGFLIDRWLEAPWFGLGYAAGTRIVLARFVRESGLGIGSAHDAVSKVLVELGVAGGVLLAVIVVITCLEMVKLTRAVKAHPDLQPVAAQALAIFAFFTLNNAVSAGVAEVPLPFIVVSAGSAAIRRIIQLRQIGFQMLGARRAIEAA